MGTFKDYFFFFKYVNACVFKCDFVQVRSSQRPEEGNISRAKLQVVVIHLLLIMGTVLTSSEKIV